MLCTIVSQISFGGEGMPNFKFELKKILRGKKIVILLLFCLLIPTGVFYWNYTNLDRYGNDLFRSVQSEYISILNTRALYYEEMDESDLTSEEIEFHMAPYNEMLDKIVTLMQMIDYESRYEVSEHMLTFHQAYENYTEHRAIHANGNQLYYLQDGNLELIESEKAFFQELENRGLPYEDPIYSIYGANFVKSVVDLTFGMALILLLILLVVDIFSEEKTNDTEKVRLTQPVNRLNILVAKMSASFLYTLSFLLLTAMVSYLLAGSVGAGFGSIHYPVRDALTGIYVGEYIVSAAFYFSLYLLAILSCIVLFAIVVKDTAIVAVLAIFTVVISGGINPSYLNPFCYLNFDHFIIRAQGDLWLMTGIALAFSILVTLLAYYLSKTTWVQNFTLTGKDAGKVLPKYEEKRALPFPYFRFEILKIIKRKTTVIPFVLLLILVSLYGLNQYNQYEKTHNFLKDHHHKVVADIGNRIDPEADPRKHNQSSLNRSYEANLKALEAYTSGDADDIIEAQKEVFHDFSITYHEGFPAETIAVFNATQDEIRARQVHPVLSDSTLMQGLATTPFAREHDLRYWSHLNYNISQPSTTYIFNSLFKDGLGILALAVFAISLALGFSNETHDTRTIYLLNTQPLHGKRIYFGKLLAQSVVFISMALIMAAVLFLGLKLSGNPTESNFPAVQYLNEIDEDYSGSYLLRENLTENRGKELPDSASTLVGFTFRDMIYENAEMAAMFILSGLGMVAFAILASLKIRHKIGVSLGTVLVFGLGFLVSRYALKGTSIFFPFIWLDTPLVATGEASMIFDKTNMTGLCGILVLILWLIAFVILGYKVFGKRGRYQ